MNFDANNPFGAAKEVGKMCQLVEDYAKEKIREAKTDIIVSLLKNGASVDLIATSMPDIPRTMIEELNKQLKATI